VPSQRAVSVSSGERIELILQCHICSGQPVRFLVSLSVPPLYKLYSSVSSHNGSLVTGLQK
jgi:hypothetical protein